MASSTCPSIFSNKFLSTRSFPFTPATSSPFFHSVFQPQKDWQVEKHSGKRMKNFPYFCTSYEVGGGYTDSGFSIKDGPSEIHEQLNQKLDTSEYEAIIKGGEQVTSVLEEMITLLEDMNMDEASEVVAVELAAQGVIGKRVDQMESGFMMALDYMIQLAEKDEDDKRKSLLEVIKGTVLSHLTKKCPPHVQVIGLLCRTPQKESRHELLRRVAAGGGEFKSQNGTKVHLPGANLNDIANQADDLLEVNFLSKLVALRPGKRVQEMIKDVMLGNNEGAENSGSDNDVNSITGRKPVPVRPGMFLETVTKVLGGIYAGNVSGITAQHLEWVHQKTLQVLQEIAF
ncbi:hypothetical protein Nepgr_004289 [Nepenthes gracilis]|uniref:Uncharacterized protein n=1 Tax=Nepenthes gracilis TaxID=150966 RepID=A0AAD3S132_NEPGR|nr:hypothetical protein Nepgr_004289 [Nepenthes gracilis]